MSSIHISAGSVSIQCLVRRPGLPLATSVSLCELVDLVALQSRSSPLLSTGAACCRHLCINNTVHYVLNQEDSKDQLLTC